MRAAFENEVSIRICSACSDLMSCSGDNVLFNMLRFFWYIIEDVDPRGSGLCLLV